MARTQVLHEVRGFKMSVSYAKQVMRDHCSITWVVEGETIRDTTDAERIEMRAKQAERIRRAEPLPYLEVHGLKHIAPKTTRYRAPIEAYDDVDTMPLLELLNKCRWPRRAHEFIRKAA